MPAGLARYRKSHGDRERHATVSAQAARLEWIEQSKSVRR